MIRKKSILLFIIFQSIIASATAADSSEIIYLDQGWTAEDRANYYWTSQGSALMSYDIYLNLAVAGSTELFNSSKHSNAMGLLVDPPNPKANPDNLPVGITKTVIDKGQFTGTFVGVTCAACHTGQIQYQGKQIRIDGGAGTWFDTSVWIRSLYKSLDETVVDPQRFKQMIDRMKLSGEVNEQDVRKRLETDTQHVKNEIDLAFISPFLPGPGRVDALGKIHNSIIGVSPNIPVNIRPTPAPVKPPFLWYAPNSSWVQWSGVADNPLRRNYVEAVGVFARYDLTRNPANEDFFETTVDVKGLIKIETHLRHLAPPQWPENVFGKLDQAKVFRGKELYKENCLECHTISPFRWSEQRKQGKRFIENAIVPRDIIGTDDQQFNGVSFDPKVTMLTKQLSYFLKGKTMAVNGELMDLLLPKMMERSLKNAGPFTAQEILDFNGYTGVPNDSSESQGIRGFKAAPREGTWAIAPYLHNSSVPNLYELLSPAAERSKKFQITREFDPVKLGIVTKGRAEDYVYDTSLIGNSNAGHSFENGTGKGIIGRLLTQTERYDLIEFVKSLPLLPAQISPYGSPKDPVLAAQDPLWFNYNRPYTVKVAN